MNEALRLRPTTPDDLDFVVAAEQDPDTRPFIVRWSRERHAAALRDPDVAHRVIDGGAAGAVGLVIVAGLASPNAAIELRRIVVSAKGRGYGRAAVRLVKRWAFVEQGAHRLWLDVRPGNRRARYLYESEGFIVEGTLRECLREDWGYESLVVMSMLRSEYRTA